jgi:alpha-ribazole phosphatase
MTIYLIRHTETNVSKSMIYGASDVGLSNNFGTELLNIKDKLALINLPNIVLISSPLSRCTQLATALSTHFSTTFETDNRLKEMNFGDWEGKKWADIEPETLNKWMMNYVEIAPPNGETYQQLADRCADFLTEKTKNLDPSVSLFIVAHGGTIRALMHAAMGVALEKTFDFNVDFGSISILNFKHDRFSLKKWNT